MGVIVLQGEKQASLIENQLLQRLGAEEIERRHLICGNPYSFQGDERDIIFLSLVAAPNERIGTLTQAPDVRRFNVAASRARDMMILFHSVTASDLSSLCLRTKLLEFFENSSPRKVAGIELEELERRALQDNRNIVSPPQPFDSWFEVDVALELLRKDYNVLPQYEVAGRRIDLVIEGGISRVAVECDGDYWHGPDQYEADMNRQRQLERCGWEFFRIREAVFYANREAALANLWPMLEERSILPNSRLAEIPTDDSLTDVESTDVESTDVESTDVESTDVESTDGAQISRNDREANSPRTRNVADVTNKEIREAILTYLSSCPNYSCKVDNLPTHVLRELGIITRGKPRVEFGKKVNRAVSVLERQNKVRKYRATNERIKLTAEYQREHEAQASLL